MPNPPKPKAIKELQGNPGKRAINKNEPKVEVQELKAPIHLPQKAKTAFKQLSSEFAQAGVLTSLDAKALELLCDTYSEYRDLKAQLNKDGFTQRVVSTQGGETIKAHPAVSMMHKSRDQIVSMLREFGATPSARTRVSVNTPDEEDPLDKFLNSRH